MRRACVSASLSLRRPSIAFCFSRFYSVHNPALKEGETLLVKELPSAPFSIPLYSSLPGVPSSNPPLQQWGEIQSSVLENGARVNTIANKSPRGSIRLDIQDVGPRFESDSSLGYSHFLKYLAFSRTIYRSPVRIVREIEMLAHQYWATIQREQISLASRLVSSRIPAMTSLLLDITRPKLREYILREAGDEVRRETREATGDIRTSIIESLHDAAFRSIGLGNPLYCPEFRIESISYESLESLEQFILTHYQPENFVFTAVGDIDHQLLVDHISKEFNTLEEDQVVPTPTDWTPIPRPKVAAAKYAGDASVRLRGDHDPHLVVAFEGLPATFDSDWYALKVLDEILGGGAKYSDKGPGSGYTSRLFTDLVQSNADAKAANTLNIGYKDTGLWGVYAHGENKQEIVQRVTDILKGIYAGKISENDVARGKANARIRIVKGVENCSGKMGEFLGQQARAGHPIKNPSEFCKPFDAVTVGDVQRVARRVLGSKVTVVAAGPWESLPEAGDIEAAIKK